MRAARAPWGCPGGPSSPSRRRPSTACGSCSRTARRACACRSSSSPGPFPRGCHRSIPLLELLGGQETRADQARVGTALSELNAYPIHERWKRAPRRLLACAVEEEVRALREAAADHDVLRLERVDRAGEPDAQVGAESLEQL